MPFLTYAETRPWAKAIREQVLARKMPPWFADPAYGHFANDRSLSQSEIDTLAAWVNAGAPAGDRDGCSAAARLAAAAGISERPMRSSKCRTLSPFPREARSIINT